MSNTDHIDENVCNNKYIHTPIYTNDTYITKLKLIRITIVNVCINFKNNIPF